MKGYILETMEHIKSKIEAAKGKAKGVTQDEIIEMAFKAGIKYAIDEMHSLKNAPLVPENKKEVIHEISAYLTKKISE